MQRPSTAAVAAAAALDVGCVVVFAALGRRSHQEAGGVLPVLEVAAPFLLALAAGWLVARAWTAPSAVRTGLVVWLAAVAGGQALRGVAFDRGVAVSFVMVTAVTLGVVLLGWRMLARWAAVRRPTATDGP